MCQLAVLHPTTRAVTGGCVGHFLLTLLLMPALQRGVATSGSFGARIVNVASVMHFFGKLPKDPFFRDNAGAYSTSVAYGNSKLAQVLGV